MAKEYAHKVIKRAPTINYHIVKACNMSCGFCFATFMDVKKGRLDKDNALKLVDTLCLAGFRKMNFAGGEPTLVLWLADLIRRAKYHGLTTSIVTNGSRVTEKWLDGLSGSLDIMAISIDSVDSDTQRKIGRHENGKAPLDATYYLGLAAAIKARSIRLKVNTVVNRANHEEDLRQFILAMNPERWKIFQALPVNGQNDAHINEFTVSDREFAHYVERNRRVEEQGIEVVPESNELMTGSYVMVDPQGRFYDNVAGRHTYSAPILQVGVRDALDQITVDAERFESRGGVY